MSETRTEAYELGRARGACYGRTEPNERDWEWLAEKLGDGDEDADVEPDLDDFMEGMLDGAEQVAAKRIGANGTSPPSAEAIEAARDR